MGTYLTETPCRTLQALLMQVSTSLSLSLLPVSLALVHIPRQRLQSLSTLVLRQIILPKPQFLNITANDIELSIFAEEHTLNDFLPIARRDRQHRRQHPIELSYEKWSVLQIDSHSDQAVDNAGARVHELSAPLAAAGISILYQSSYMSDFMFVKESQLQQVLHILAARGFDLLSPEAASMTGSPTVTVNPRGLTGVSAEEPASPRSKSHSPTTSDVRILSPDLACVGLSDEFGVDHWGLKIVKLVAFPDLIPGATPSSQNSSQTDCSSPMSSDDGYYSHSPQSTSLSSHYPSRSHSFDDLHSPIQSPSKSASKHSYMSPYTHSPSRQSTYPSKHSEYPSSSHQQQFFSFTRTPEGSSLTADVCVLATLFPPHERHMVICGGELAAADERIANGMAGYSSDPEEDDGSDDASMLRCLQLDLRKFGLGKCLLSLFGCGHILRRIE